MHDDGVDLLFNSWIHIWRIWAKKCSKWLCNETFFEGGIKQGINDGV